MSRQQLEKVIGIIKTQPPVGTQPVDISRQFLDEGGAKFLTPEDVMLSPFALDGLEAEFIDAPGVDKSRVLLYLHGGGYVIGSITSHRYLMQNLSRASGMRVLGINYRMGPEHPFPAAIEDAVKSYRWLLGQGYVASRLAIGGDSAGGGLTLACLISLRDAGDPLPAAALCISPWTDLTGNAESLISRRAIDPMIDPDSLYKLVSFYMGDQDPAQPLASPVFADLSGLPPMLVQVGECEVLYDDAITLARNAQAAGVEVTLEETKDMFHVWHAFAPMLDEAQQAVDRAGNFLRRILA